MRLRQVPEQPHTYIVENDHHRQLGTVDEIHRHQTTNQTDSGTVIVRYIGTRFTGLGAPMFEQKEFSGFTAALQYVGGN